MPRFVSVLLLCLTQNCLTALVLPVLNDPIDNLSKLTNDSSDAIALNSVFGTEAIDNQVVRFTTQTSIGSLQLDLALFTNRAPGTRANFLNYVNDGDFVNSFIHRSVPGFVIQGGGFVVANSQITPVPTDPPIANEFGISNTLGTISMAKLGGDPDSATSGWFVSIGENSDNLDNQNGGFTVFGRMTKSTLPNALSIGNPVDFPRWDFSTQFGDAFSVMPLNPDFVGDRGLAVTDLVLFATITLETIPATEAGSSTTLSYSILSNSDPSIATASIKGSSELVLDYSGNNAGSTSITVRATDSVGNTVDDTFVVTTALRTFDDWKSENFSEAEQADFSISGPEVDNNNDSLTNLELYLHNLNQTDFHLSPVVFSETEILSDSHATFTFPIRNDLADISYTIEQSDDLGLIDDWSATPFSEISRVTAGAIDTVSIRTTAPTSGSNDFYRMRFSQTP